MHACKLSTTCLSLQLLGAAIKSLPREDIIVCTKIGKYSPGEALKVNVHQLLEPCKPHDKHSFL